MYFIKRRMGGRGRGVGREEDNLGAIGARKEKECFCSACGKCSCGMTRARFPKLLGACVVVV